MDIDDPESFISNLPSEATLAKDRLRRAGFRYSPDFLATPNADDSCAAWYKSVDIDFLGYGPRAYVVLQVELPHYVIGMTDIEHRWMATYDQVTGNRTEAVNKLLELTARLERHELEVRNQQFHTVLETESKRVVNNMSKITEGRHKAGCQCGFCKNMNLLRKNKGGKPDKADKADDKADKDNETKNESLRAAKIVAKLLDD